jgi:hypothetical protein
MHNLLVKAITLTAIISLFIANVASAHCDTMDGPVVKDAKKSLEKGDVNFVLRWVKKEYEKEVSQLFQEILKVRRLNSEAKQIADMYLFETVVRLHRAGEGEPYTGIKPVGAPIDQIIAEADKALEKNNIKELSTLLNTAVEEGIVSRFNKTAAAQKDADKSVDNGRKYVEAYVSFVHYLENIEQVAEGEGHNHDIKGPGEIHE